MMEPDFWVTFNHLHSMPGSRRPGWCHDSCRVFADRDGLDWNAIVLNKGRAASELLAPGDAMALRLVEHARRERDHGAR